MLSMIYYVLIKPGLTNGKNANKLLRFHILSKNFVRCFFRAMLEGVLLPSNMAAKTSFLLISC